MKDKLTETDTALTAVTPIDGRYRARTRSLEAYFSEFALIRYRVRVEIEWYLSLAGHPEIGALKPLPKSPPYQTTGLRSSDCGTMFEYTSRERNEPVI